MTTLASLEDYTKWEKLIAHCDSLEWSELDRAQAKRAISFLRSEMGEGFLIGALEAHHPFSQHILNLAPWTRKWLRKFADELRIVRSSLGYEGLLSRIIDPRRYHEAAQVLDIAAAFRRQGFDVAIDPELRESGFAKVPDLLLTDHATGDRIYLEVSELQQSDVARKAHETMGQIHAPLWQGVPFLHFALRIYKSLSPRHLEDVVGQVSQLVERCRAEDAFGQLLIEGVLEMGIAPEADKALLEHWAETGGLSVGTVQGPPIRVDEVQRVRAKVRNEQEQLPTDLPGIVVVLTNQLFPFVQDHRAVIHELEECVYEHGHLLAGVVAGGYLGGGIGQDVLLMHGQHLYLRKTTCDMLVEEFVVLLNQFCEHKVSPSSITKLFNAFRPELR